MKVKITYTVDFEEVLREVKRITASNVEAACDAIKSLEAHEFSDSNLSESIDMLDSLRKKLYGVDASMQDAAGILKSYMHAKYPNPEEKESRELLNG